MDPRAIFYRITSSLCLSYAQLCVVLPGYTNVLSFYTLPLPKSKVQFALRIYYQPLCITSPANDLPFIYMSSCGYLLE